MLGHLSLGVRDLEGAGAFYDAVFATLGAARVWSNPRGIGYGHGDNDRFSLRQAPDGSAPAAGPGFHLAFDAPSQAAVDAFHAAALARGARCDGPPGPRPQYGATYYAAFLYDPDGHRLEVVHQER